MDLKIWYILKKNLKIWRKPSGFQVIMQLISYFLGTLYYILLKKGLSTNMPLENNGNSTCHAQILVGFIANFEVLMLYIA